jgi:hypothetical protein
MQLAALPLRRSIPLLLLANQPLQARNRPVSEKFETLQHFPSVFLTCLHTQVIDESINTDVAEVGLSALL